MRPLCVLVLALGLPGAAGCVRYLIPEGDLERLEKGELLPGEAVFICHGMLLDLGLPWDHALREEISGGPEGRLALMISYFAGPGGVWFNWSCRAPGRTLASLADEMERLHRATGCPAPLRLSAVGFSAGAEAVVEGAGRLAEARLERVLLLQPSLFAFNPEPRRLIASGKVGEVQVVWSPIDVITLLAPLGAGMTGLRAAGERIENHLSLRPHAPPLSYAERAMVRALLLEGPGERPAASPAHTCGQDSGYRARLAAFLRAGRAPD